MISPKLTAGLSVAFQTEVLDGGIVTSYKRAKNLVLDCGLDMFAEYNSLAALFPFVALGTGTKPTRRDSGTITASQTGNTVTASGAFFEAADVGRLLKFDSGDEVYISEVSSSSSATVADSVSRSASGFTVWYVNATGHETEHSRISNITAETSSFIGGKFTITRTFLSGAFGSGALIKEIGWAPTIDAGSPLFGRALVPGGGDYVGAGKQYRVTVSLSCEYGPAGIVAQADVGNNGFSTAGTYALEYAPPFTAGSQFKISLNQDSEPLSPLQSGNAPGLDSAIAYFEDTAAAAYVSGSCSRSWSGKIASGDGISSSVMSLRFNYAPGGTAKKTGRILLSSAQSKDAAHTLSLTFAMTWGRTLIN